MTVAAAVHNTEETSFCKYESFVLLTNKLGFSRKKSWERDRNKKMQGPTPNTLEKRNWFEILAKHPMNAIRFVTVQYMLCDGSIHACLRKPGTTSAFVILIPTKPAKQTQTSNKRGMVYNRLSINGNCVSTCFFARIAAFVHWNDRRTTFGAMWDLHRIKLS